LTLADRQHHATLQFLDAGGEAACYLGAIIEGDQEKFIARTGRPQKLNDGWRAFSTLSAMLPLISKIKPIEMGTSSLEKAEISCSTPSS
jgi:hypothetical protein